MPPILHSLEQCCTLRPIVLVTLFGRTRNERPAGRARLGPLLRPGGESSGGAGRYSAPPFAPQWDGPKPGQTGFPQAPRVLSRWLRRGHPLNLPRRAVEQAVLQKARLQGPAALGVDTGHAGEPREPSWSGRAMRFPKPPRGIVSWLGKNRSYDSMPSWCRRAMASVTREQPIFRATTAGTGVAKKNHTHANRPRRSSSEGAPTDAARSRATGGRWRGRRGLKAVDAVPRALV